MRNAMFRRSRTKMNVPSRWYGVAELLFSLPDDYDIYHAVAARKIYGAERTCYSRRCLQLRRFLLQSVRGFG